MGDSVPSIIFRVDLMMLVPLVSHNFWLSEWLPYQLPVFLLSHLFPPSFQIFTLTYSSILDVLGDLSSNLQTLSKSVPCLCAIFSHEEFKFSCS